MKKKIKTFFAACSKNKEPEEVDAQPDVTDVWTVCFLVMSERQIVTQCDCQYRALSVIMHSGRHHLFQVCMSLGAQWFPTYQTHQMEQSMLYSEVTVSNFFSPPHDDQFIIYI